MHEELEAVTKRSEKDSQNGDALLSDYLREHPVMLAGRVHQSDVGLMPFATFPDRDDVDFQAYIDEVFNGDIETGTYWAIVIGDKPGIARFTESNGFTFCFGIGLGAIAAVFIFAVVRSKRRRRTSGTDLPT